MKQFTSAYLKALSDMAVAAGSFNQSLSAEDMTTLIAMAQRTERAETLLAELVKTARPSFPRTPFRAALDAAEDFLKD